VVTEIRGLGLLFGIGLDPARIAVGEGEMPALKVVQSLISKGLITVPAGPETVRLLPPLNVTDAEIDEALAILKDTLAEY
jgi:acetylornithine/succinyldiaminopimelate/putrescine aminotransferase